MKSRPTLSCTAAAVLLFVESTSGAHASAKGSVKHDAGVDKHSNMGWLIEACPGKRDAVQKERLKECVQWSTGLEHETFLVHRKDGNKEEYVVNVGSVANQMARYGRVFGLDRQTHSVALYLEQTGVEFSGRSCAGINEINFKAMAESVSMDHEQLSFDSALCQVELLDAKIIEVISSSPNEASLTSSLGAVQAPRAGMSSQLGLYTRTGGENYWCSTCEGCDLKDYTGSYHLSISLPRDSNGWVVHDESALSEDGSDCSETYVKETEHGRSQRDAWVEAHKNLANMVQWIEPLILAVYGTSDSEAVCDDGEFAEGSYRTMSSGWGIPGSTDVRTFGEVGTGRYTHTGFDWLLELVTESGVGILGCEAEGMGSDIRTISSPLSEGSCLPTCQCLEEDGKEEATHALPDGPPKMEVGQGIEIRVFDNFPAENMKTLYRVVALVAEASRVHHADEYIYDDAGWKASAQAAMTEGWNAILDAKYVDSLERNLDVDLSALQGNSQAFAVFEELCTQLAHRHSDGFWTGLFLDDVDADLIISSPNRNSWESAAMDRGVTPVEIREMLDLNGLPSTGSVIELEEIVAREGNNTADGFGPTGCLDDVEDLIYLAETYGIIEYLETHENGSVKAFGFAPAWEDWEIDLRECAAN